MQKIIVPTIFFLLVLLALVATKSTKSDKGSDYDGEENGRVSKGQHHKIPFRETKKSVPDGNRNGDIAVAHGASGIYSLQIQVKVPLQTAYSPKKGGSGGYEGSSGDGKVTSLPEFEPLSWLSSPIKLTDFS